MYAAAWQGQRRCVAALLLALAAVPGAAHAAACGAGGPCVHVHDRAGFIPAADVPRFESLLARMKEESDIDVRLVFHRADRAAATLPPEELMDRLGAGARTGDRRGLLLVFDVDRRALRVEVGYGLESMFPDVLVAYLAGGHARGFFAHPNPSASLRLLLRLLQHRVREAVLDGRFDPRAYQALGAGAHLSGGAGASVSLAARPDAASRGGPAPAWEPAATPGETYARYLSLLSGGPWRADAALFTEPSRRYLENFPLTDNYRHFIFLGEFGKKPVVVERGELALIYFAGTPFTAPHFLVRQGGRWQMDLVAEVRNTQEIVGGELTWTWRGRGDAYTQRFGDLLVDLRGYRRIAAGDNRPLPVARAAPGR